MDVFCALVLQLCVAAVPRGELLPMPTDVSGYAQGVNAASFDPAAAGRLDGAELQIRQLGVPDARGHGAWAGYGAVPLAALSLYAGYEWRSLPDPISERGTFGLSLALLPNLRLGASLRRLQLPGSALTHTLWDAGLAGQPTRWLSYSLGGEALNAPSFAGLVHVNRALRAGVAIRPWRGDPRLVLAADTRLQQLADGWQASDTRVLAELGLREGVHVMGGYARRAGAHQAFAGLRFDLWHAAVQSSAQVDNATAAEGIDRWGFLLSLRQHPQEQALRVRPRRVEVSIEGQLNPPPQSVFHPGKAISMLNVELAELARDPSVQTVVLPIGALQIGLGQIAELRQSVHALRQAGKHVIAQLHDADNKSLMLAAAASEIQMDPLGYINLKGFSIASHFFAEALSKIGVRFEAVGVGQYKSAPDALTQSTPRPQDKEVYDAILAEAYKHLVDSLVVDRHLSPADCNAVLDIGLLGAQQAKQLGLIDAIVPQADAPYRDNEAPLAQSFAQTQVPTALWGRPDVIAIVPVIGTIVSQPADNPMPSTSAQASRVTGLLDAAVADARVAGIVVRIDSPGGDVFASESIWRAMYRAAQAKPVAVSMGDVAASGGYYLAAPAGRIFAQPTSLTGSIGIFLLKPDVSGLLAWTGVQRTVYSKGAHADWESTEHGLSETDRARLQTRLQSLYDVFVSRVADGRHLPLQTVRTLAQGRVYTGAQARELGLVDELGGLNDAIDWVRQTAQLKDDAWVQLQVPNRTLSLPQLVTGMSGLVRSTLAQSTPKDPAHALYESLQHHVRSMDSKPLALLPFDLEVVSP